MYYRAPFPRIRIAGPRSVLTAQHSHEPRATRARISVPVTEQRIVILTYVPVNRIDIPIEAREKLKAARTPAAAAARNP